jgi:hypothetical protein
MSSTGTLDGVLTLALRGPEAKLRDAIGPRIS